MREALTFRGTHQIRLRFWLWEMSVIHWRASSPTFQGQKLLSTFAMWQGRSSMMVLKVIFCLILSFHSSLVFLITSWFHRWRKFDFDKVQNIWSKNVLQDIFFSIFNFIKVNQHWPIKKVLDAWMDYTRNSQNILFTCHGRLFHHSLCCVELSEFLKSPIDTLEIHAHSLSPQLIKILSRLPEQAEKENSELFDPLIHP